MTGYLQKKLPQVVVLSAIALYVTYFSVFTILRSQKFHAHYFDLGIMHQAVYNTYQALKGGDFSRILEITDPHGSTEQVKRMAVHNDVLLMFLAPFYFIHEGPATLLVIQSLIVGLGAWFVFGISRHAFREKSYVNHFSILFSLAYLLYPPLQKANNFDFHAVTLATTFLLAMFYFYLKKKYTWSAFFAVASILSKEQVGLTIAFFGMYVLTQGDSFREIISPHRLFILFFRKVRVLNSKSLKEKLSRLFGEKSSRYATILVMFGLVWVFLSLFVIIPHFRMGEHFGAKYFTYLKDAPWKAIPVLLRYESFHYVYLLLAPLGFLSLLSPTLLIASPDIGMNLLAANGNMRNIYFHYDAVITPFVFISAIYGAKNILNWEMYLKRISFAPILIFKNLPRTLFLFLMFSTVAFTLYLSPLPWGHHRDLYPWRAYPQKYQDVAMWKAYLADDALPVSTTGHLAPHFTSRRYFYNFAEGYDKAKYIIIDTTEISSGFQVELKEKNYRQLLSDWRYVRIYQTNGIEVYKRL